MPLKECQNNGVDGWKWGDQGRCYTGKDAKKQAIRQGVAIEGPKKFAEIMKSESSEWSGKSLYNQLSSDEKSLADSLIELTRKIGPLDKSQGIWTGYEGAEKNLNKTIGVKCSNCALHVSDNVCSILDNSIEPEGACRFAVIPDGYVSAKVNQDIKDFYS